MSAGPISVPEITEPQLRKLRTAALDPESRGMVEIVLGKSQATVALAAGQIDSIERHLRRLQVELERWKAAHDTCLRREQTIQAILDETQEARRV